MWFCIKCGRRVEKSELIRGYCPECFVKHVNILQASPGFKLVRCPVCGSWIFRGEWLPPVSDEEATASIVSHEIPRFLIKGASLLDIEIKSLDYIDDSTMEIETELDILVDEKPVSVTRRFVVKLVHNKCPKCIARSVGKHTHLVQVRFTDRDPPSELLQDLSSFLHSSLRGDSVVNVRELPEGIDIELDDSTAARRLIDALSKHYSAKIDTSFRPTRFDPSQGKWIGVTTYVARIPVFREDEVVLYRDRISIVRAVDRGRIIVEIPETSELRELDLRSYWRKELRHPVRVEREILVVREIRGEHIVVENTATGEIHVMKTRDRFKQLKPGDQLILIRADNIETIVYKTQGD